VAHRSKALRRNRIGVVPGNTDIYTPRVDDYLTAGRNIINAGLECRGGRRLVLRAEIGADGRRPEGAVFVVLGGAFSTADRMGQPPGVALATRHTKHGARPPAATAAP